MKKMRKTRKRKKKKKKQRVGGLIRPRGRRGCSKLRWRWEGVGVVVGWWAWKRRKKRREER
jgi:hypothetical protein